jgi:hypothetical protein
MRTINHSTIKEIRRKDTGSESIFSKYFGIHLKVHQVEEFVDLRRQNFHRLLIDVHPIRLLVRLNTNTGVTRIILHKVLEF